MDCLRSAFDGPVDLLSDPMSLEGRAGAGALPKKSNPSRDSAGLLCFAGATLAFGGGCVPAGGPVLGLAGAEISSPNRSSVALGACLAVACLCDEDRSTAAADCAGVVAFH